MKTPTARQLASRLAAAAREVRDRLATILAAASAGPLARLLQTLRAAQLEDVRELADMYAQTIAYGLLAARIADRSRPPAEDLLTDPFIDALVQAGVQLEHLGVDAVVELLDADLARIVHEFAAQNPDEDPVLRLYEYFLAAYDPRKRADRGVFYTPRPVVTYIVRSVDAALRADFGLTDGLADTTTWAELLARRPDLELPADVAPDQAFVQILDPATGTGTFLVEVVDHIHKIMLAGWTALGHTPGAITDLWRAYVPAHLLPRLHGYELMLAPLAIAHMQLAMKLRATGYHPEPGARAQIFLTNALTPARDARPDLVTLMNTPLTRELWAADAVKRDRRFTVVIGNPPYAGVSPNMGPAARRLVDAYKLVDGRALGERKQWLQDDYVKFMRAAQSQIDRAGVGVIGLVTNHGYLDNPTFRGMRQSLLASFSRLYLLDLHGNAARPVRVADENVFDIRQGVAVIVATRGPGEAAVLHAGLTGTRIFKNAWLAAHDVTSGAWTALRPDSPLYLFTPQDPAHRAEYERGWRLDVAMPVHCAGFITARDHFVVDLDESALLARIDAFADLRRSDEDIRATYFAGRGAACYPAGDTRGWKLPDARRRVAADPRRRERATLCSYRPFDRRWIYWADWMVDWPRPEVSGHMLAGPNLAFHVCRQTVDDAWAHILVARGLIDDCYVSNRTRERGYTHPLYLHTADRRAPNFAPDFLAALAAAIDLPQIAPHGLPNGLSAEQVFHYIYAVCFSPDYRHRHAAQLQRGFPRVPLPGSRALMLQLAALGEQLAGLHLGESPAAAQVASYVGPAEPVVGRVRWADETVWLDAARPGAMFRGVPAAVWGFVVGGYRPCEKWLRDRRGRTLCAADIAHYHDMLGAAARTLELAPCIDEVIARHGGWPAAFHRGSP